MRSDQNRVLETARHVQHFLDETTDRIGPRIASARRNLDDAVAQMTTLAVSQADGRIAGAGATARQKSLRTVLRVNHMKPVAEVAKQLLRDVPEFRSLTMPRERLGATRLIVTATAMARAAEPYAALFTEVGLPDDFLAQLLAAADAVQLSIATRQERLAQRTGATAGLTAQESRARSLFKVINALVVPTLGSDAVLIGKWKSTRAIAPKSTSARAAAPTSPPTAAALSPTTTQEAPITT